MASLVTPISKTDVCYVCSSVVGDPSKWIGCGACQQWAHIKCVKLSGVKHEHLKDLSWVCADCLNRLKGNEPYVLKLLIEIKDTFREEFAKMNEKINTLSDMVHGVQQEVGTEGAVIKAVDAAVSAGVSAGISAQSAEIVDGEATWAEVVSKKKRMKAKKHLLVVKAADDNAKATDKKNEVLHALTGVQAVDSRFTKGGDIVMNFENESMRDEAVQKLEVVEEVTTKSVKKLKPKIMICNVPQEESKDMLIENLIDRNAYLQAIPEIESKMELIFAKPAAGGTQHYILKCDPAVRELIYKNNDKVKLEWGIYKVRDRYHALICYYCQRYGHVEDKCTAKQNGEDPHCYKCAGNHKSKDCGGNEKKCINCIRFKKPAHDHNANYSGCPVLESELVRIRNSTAHGY